MLPYVASYPLGAGEDRPVTWRKAWEAAEDGGFVLESGKGGRYTFLGIRPSASIQGKGSQAVIVDGETGQSKLLQGKPLEMLKQFMAPYQAPAAEGAPKWLGGCVGFLGYDTVRSLEKLPEQAADDLSVPDYAFVRVNQLWIIDHVESRLYLSVYQSVDPAWSVQELRQTYTEAERIVLQMKEQWDAVAAVNQDEASLKDRRDKLDMMQADHLSIDPEWMSGVYKDFPKEQFISAVERIQEYIRAGDVFQVNLSVRQHTQLQTSPEDIYEWLRCVNPSPYMGLLRFPDFQLVSGSPELLIQLERGTLRTRPIAGTRPRGRTPEEDRQLADELIGHEKERAEHIMLVDLERNDIGKIAAYGSVRVSELMSVEYYSHVMHIVTEIEGRLGQNRDTYDALAAVFPGGTITGAPKIRTMEIIEELEPVRRGPYTGAMGWIDYNGDMEFNIIIRTLVAAQGNGYVQAGAGIVIDSIAEKEYIESLNKAKAVWKAIQYSERAAAAEAARLEEARKS